MAVCGECGSEVNSDDKFCRNCGNKYDIETILEEPKAPDNTEQQAIKEVAEQNNDIVEVSEKNNLEKDIQDKKSLIDTNYVNKKNITITISIIVVLLIPTVAYPCYHVWWTNVDSIESNQTQNDGVGFSSGSNDLLALFWDDMDHTSLEYSLDNFEFNYEYQIYAVRDVFPNNGLNLILEESCKFSADSECKLQLVPQGKTGWVEIFQENSYDQCWVPEYSPLYIAAGKDFLSADHARSGCGMSSSGRNSQYPADFYWYSGFGIVENNYNIFDTESTNGLPLYFELRIQFSIETTLFVPSPPSNWADVTIQIDMLDYDNDLVNDYDDYCPEDYAQTSNGCP